MTTDIKELMQALRIAAERAKSAAEKSAAEKSANGEINPAEFARQCSEFNSLTDSPAQILDLLDELEGATSHIALLKIDRRELIREAEVKDARIAELDCKLEQVRTQSSKWLEAYHKAVSVGARYEERIAELETYLEIHERAAVAAIERAEMADRRAVELQSRAEAAESRVVSVALPDLRQAVSGERYVWSDGFYNYAQDVRKILTAAGIQIQGGE